MSYLGWAFLILIIVSVVFNPPDSTDKSWLDRSGLTLYTDNLTGLQYIKGGVFGNMIPRLDENGKQMRSLK